MYVVKNFLIVDSLTGLSSELSNIAIVFNVNPLLSLRIQKKSCSLVENCDSGPAFCPFPALVGSLQFQKVSESSGQIQLRKLYNASNWGAVRSTKCFIKAELLAMASNDMLLTTLGVVFGSPLIKATSFFSNMVSNFADNRYFENSV